MASHRDIEPISRREMEILRLTAQGKSMQEMATEKGIGAKTVETQCGHLRAKFGVPLRRQPRRSGCALWVSGLVKQNGEIDEKYLPLKTSFLLILVRRHSRVYQ